MTSGPVFLLALLLLASGAVYLLRRIEPLAALLAAAAAAWAALRMWKATLDVPATQSMAGRPVAFGEPLVIQGITLRITPAAQVVLVFLLAAAAISFILAWQTHQGRTFYPFGLALVALWTTAALIRPLPLAPVMLALASIVAVFLIQAGQAGDTQGAWRQMLFPTLAVPLFLVATWYMEQAPLNPDDPAPLRIAGWLLVAGFMLLLQPAPLHVAMPAVARQSPPVVAAFLWIGGQSIVLFLFQRFMVSYPWLADTVDSARWLLWLGVLTAVSGGVLAATQDRLGTFAGYAVVYDYGVLLVAMALGGARGASITIGLLLTRTVALLTLASGIAMLRHHMEGDRLDEIEGAASRLPWATAAMVVGGLGLAGIPLTAQFASRWALLQRVSEIDIRWAILVMLGSLGVLAGTLRAGKVCFGKLRGSQVQREPATLVVLALVLVAASVLLSLLPQLLHGPVTAAVLPLLALEP